MFKTPKFLFTPTYRRRNRKVGKLVWQRIWIIIFVLTFASLRIEPSIQRIIDRYASILSPYIFPILTSTETKQSYEEYQVAINSHNRLLRRLSKMLPTGCKLTSYTSRHSWATAARNHNVPISVISAGMGHTSEQTTQIYLTMLENSVIDDANQGLIKSLLE
jgi:integrase